MSEFLKFRAAGMGLSLDTTRTSRRSSQSRRSGPLSAELFSGDKITGSANATVPTKVPGRGPRPAPGRTAVHARHAARWATPTARRVGARRSQALTPRGVITLDGAHNPAPYAPG